VTAASVALWTLLAGPSRPARVLGIEFGTVYLSIDPLAAADSRDGRDHPGAVVALLDPDAVQLPIGIVLPPAAADLVPVSVAGSPVSQGEITIGWGAISLAEVRWPVLRWWNPGIPALPRPTRSIAADGVAVESVADEVPDDLAAGVAALTAGDPEAAVRQLIGVGPGLVPAGDHVLVGALAALAAWAPDAPARTVLARAVSDAVGGTTKVSAALLQAAASGFAVPELVRFLTALSTDAAGIDVARADLARLGGDFATATQAGVSGQLRALRSADRA
jgi:hypothetical protein